MTMLNKTPFQLIFRRGLRALLETVGVSTLSARGEPAYTTDTKQLFVSDGTTMQPVQTLDMAVCFEDGIVCHDDRIVFHY
jgi:hypothetical protein